MKTSFLTKMALSAALASASLCAHAGSFSCASGTVTDCALATSTLSWTWDGLNFTLSNSGSGYVSEVYFDLSAGMDASFVSGVGVVNFTPGASPANLPGGISVGFHSDEGFDSDPITFPGKGINNGESATFQITGAGPHSFENGRLAAGAHVRRLPDDSASVVTIGTVTSVPEPETYALMLGGLAAIGALSRRRQVK